jgi:hypothetical protein
MKISPALPSKAIQSYLTYLKIIYIGTHLIATLSLKEKFKKISRTRHLLAITIHVTK